jgi:hypothetical protein
LRPQKCSRFQPLTAFDGAKRTCARQLAMQNARRAARAGQADGTSSGNVDPTPLATDGGAGAERAHTQPRGRRGSVKQAVAAAEVAGAGGGRAGQGGIMAQALALPPHLLAALAPGGPGGGGELSGMMHLHTCVSRLLRCGLRRCCLGFA